MLCWVQDKLHGCRGSSRGPATYETVIGYIAKIAVHHLLQASAFLSISTIHVKTRLNQISCAEESSWTAFPINNVTLFREKQEKM